MSDRLDHEDLEESNPPKLFSIEEAARLLPKLKRLVRRIVDAHADLSMMQPDIQRARNQARSGGGSRHGHHYLKRLETFSMAVREVEDLGVLIKDYRTGLCDFPHLKDGRIVYLCWKFGEDDIEWWHETEAGFAGRKPL